jgi:ketosteroid isomerase-like protein
VVSKSSAGAAIVELVDREVAAMGAGDLGQYVALLTDDAVLLAPNTPPKAGAELRQWLGEFLQRVRVEWLSFVHDEVAVSGDLGYHVYSYTWRTSPKGGGEPTVSSGKGLHIVRRGADGAWRIAREIWNANPAT